MRAILFDIGNVLVRYDHQRTITALAALYDAEPAQLMAVYAEIGRPFGAGHIGSQQVIERLNQRFATSQTPEAFSAAFCAGLSRDDSALAYVTGLQIDGELAVGAISNTNEVHAAWLDAHVPELDEFELVILSNEVRILKPDPEIFELAMEILDVRPVQVLYIDDLAENIGAARQLGMSAVLHHDWAETRPLIEAWLAT